MLELQKKYDGELSLDNLQCRSDDFSLEDVQYNDELEYFFLA
jgi:hypothetical protein